MEASLTKPDMESTTDSGGIGIPSGSIGMAAPDKESRAAALEYARTARRGQGRDDDDDGDDDDGHGHGHDDDDANASPRASSSC